MSSEFDNALVEAGEAGRYQIIYIILLTIPATFPGAFVAFNHVFVSGSPNHWCSVPELRERGMPLSARKNLTLPLELRDGIWQQSKCLMYNVNYTQIMEQANESWPQADPRWPVQECIHGWEFDHTDYDETMVTKFNLVCSKNWLPSLAMSTFATGNLLGTILFGWLTDKYGRRPSFFINLFSIVLIPTTSAFSPNYYFYIAIRFIIGFTFPAIFQTPFIMMMEITGAKLRTPVGMIMGVLWGVAMSILCGIAALCRHWFPLILLSSLPFVVTFSYWWVIPESPRWLVTQNRIEEAEKILQKIAKANNKKLASKILQRHQKEDEDNKNQLSSVSPATLLRKPNMRKKTLLISFIWLANAVGYSGLTYMSANLGVSDYLAFSISGLVEAPSCLLAWYLMEKWGRRWTSFTIMLIVGLSCTGNIFVPEDWTIMNVLLPNIGKFGITATFSVVYIFGSEILPTVARGNGMAMGSFVSGLGHIAAPYVVYLANYSRVLPLFILGCLSITGGAAALFLPETLNTNLPQTLDEGELFGKDMKIFSGIPKKQPMKPKLMKQISSNGTVPPMDVIKESSLKASIPEEEPML